MTHHLACVQKISANDLNAAIECRLFAESDLIRSVGLIEFSLPGANGAIVDEDIIEANLRRILRDSVQMLPQIVAISLAGLRHQVCNKDFRRPRLANRCRYASDQEVRHDTRVQRSGTNR